MILAAVLIAAALYVLCRHFGTGQGSADAIEVHDRQEVDDRRELDHGKLLMFRVIMCGLLCLVGLAVMMAFKGWTWWLIKDTICMACIAYGSFTPAHRKKFNTARGMDLYYLSRGNGYDRFFLRINATARAGRIAFTVERTTLIAASAAFILTNI